jgi:hypothetical protein
MGDSRVELHNDNILHDIPVHAAAIATIHSTSTYVVAVSPAVTIYYFYLRTLFPLSTTGAHLMARFIFICELNSPDICTCH